MILTACLNSEVCAAQSRSRRGKTLSRVRPPPPRRSFSLSCFCFLSIQKGKDDYKPAPTSDDKGQKGKKGKEKKDMDDLKKEVDLVSAQKVDLKPDRV